MKKGEVKINKPECVFLESQNKIAKIEKILQAPMLVYFSSPGGEICNNDSRAIYKILSGKRIKHLYFFLTSGGGSGIAALKIVSIIRNYCDKITVLIDSDCASAATMIALGADEIVMGPLAYLTAVDTSLVHDLSPVDKNNRSVSVSMDELSRVLKLWDKSTPNQNIDSNPYKNLYEYIHPLVFGAVDRASSLSLKICREILRYHIKNEEDIQKISLKLNSDYPSHSYPILFREAKEIGLNVVEMDENLAKELQELNLIYARMCDAKFTDYDENSYHDSSVLNVIESNKEQIYYQMDIDKFYREQERRWINMNDESSWFRNVLEGKNIKNEKIYLR